MYITWIQNMAAQYIVMRLILDLCEEAERRPRVQVSKRYLDQEGINLFGEQAAETAAKTEETQGTEMGVTGD